MSISVGIGLAFVAMLCWGIGDFLIQKSTRKIGDWETLFLITIFGTAVLLPFVYTDLPALFALESRPSLFVLVGTALVLFVAALLELEAVRRGKLSVVEPLWSLEIPAAGLLALAVLGERLDGISILFIVFLIVGLFLVSFRGKVLSHRHFLERGVLLAVLAALAMGSAAFFMGWGARLTNSLLANFFASSILALISGAYLLARGRLFQTFRDLARLRLTLLPMMVADNAAWVAYAFSMTIVPIGIATALSESYIIIAVLLGLAVNRERLEFHQKVGLIAAIAAAVTLAAMTV